MWGGAILLPTFLKFNSFFVDMWVSCPGCFCLFPRAFCLVERTMNILFILRPPTVDPGFWFNDENLGLIKVKASDRISYMIQEIHMRAVMAKTAFALTPSHVVSYWVMSLMFFEGVHCLRSLSSKFLLAKEAEVLSSSFS